MMPPSAGPAAGPTTTASPNSAIAMPCSLGGNVWRRMACSVGCSAPAPRPCSARKATIIGNERARPHRAEPTTNSASENMYTRFWPKVRPRNAVNGITMTVAITKPVVTQVISSTVEPSAPRRCGVATATIEVSSAPISVPNVTDRVTSHLFTGLRAAAATGGISGTTVALTCRRPS